MGYLYLAISKFCAEAKMAAMKCCGNANDTANTSIKVNAVRSGIILIVSLIVFAIGRTATASGLWIAALGGASNALNMLSWLICATAASLCLVETFSMIGAVVIPLALSPLLYPGEVVSPLGWAGAAIMFIAVALFCVGKSVKIDFKGAVWIAVCTLSSTGVNVFSKMYAVSVGGEYAAFYNLVSFAIVFAFFAIAAAVCLLGHKSKPEPAAERGAEGTSAQVAAHGKTVFGLSGKTYIFIAVAAVGMYATNYFMTLAAAVLPSGILYPLSYAVGFVLTALTDTLIFRQKLTLVRAVATVLTIAGAVLTAI